MLAKYWKEGRAFINGLSWKWSTKSRKKWTISYPLAFWSLFRAKKKIFCKNWKNNSPSVLENNFTKVFEENHMD